MADFIYFAAQAEPKAPPSRIARAQVAYREAPFAFRFAGGVLAGVCLLLGVSLVAENLGAAPAAPRADAIASPTASCRAISVGEAFYDPAGGIVAVNECAR